ncbi:hypothetical protein [Streptomyces sp. NPDC046909]|uniref:hypothetical protein n=1 Tax=Streptomyces sp. NPDC046909 TaxID=3155617 RepID=UPI0033DCF362
MTDSRAAKVLSPSTTDHVAGLMATLAQKHDHDEDAVEEAFMRAVRKAWVNEESWALEYVAFSQNTHADAVIGALELAAETGWEPTDTVAALPGMNERVAGTLLSALEAAQDIGKEPDEA